MNKQFWNTLKQDYYKVWLDTIKNDFGDELNETQIEEYTLVRMLSNTDDYYGWECFNWEFKCEYYDKPKWACEKHEWKPELFTSFVESIVKDKLNLKTKKQVWKWYESKDKEYENYY